MARRLLTDKQVNEMAQIIKGARFLRTMKKAELYEVIYQDFEEIAGFETASDKVKKEWADKIISKVQGK